jgi:phage tail-like protein
MNVNGARFQMLLGRDDWSRCATDVDAQTLASWWDGFASPMPIPPETLPAWDRARHEITLMPQAIELPATVGEAPLTLDARRAAAADRHGNVYRVAEDSASLRVTSFGVDEEHLFWPALPADCTEVRARERPVFETHQAPEPVVVDRYLALVVTDDDYLVVAFARGDVRGLMSFDLISGGPPTETAWPAAMQIEPFALCTRRNGGAWLLDRVNRRLWELDCTLAMVDSGQSLQVASAALIDAALIDDFQPLSGPQRVQPATQFPVGLDLTGASAPFIAPSLIDPIAIASLGEGTVLVLDRDATLQRSRVVRLRRQADAWDADASQWLDILPALAHDMVYAAGLSQLGASARSGGSGSGQAPMRLFVSTEVGNQVHAFEVIDRPDGFALRAPAELYPLRRYGGRALISLLGNAHYDSGLAQPRWTRVVQQRQHRYATQAVLLTPVFDSEALGTVWDKVLLDACIPADTEISIETRASDERIVAPGTSVLPEAGFIAIGDWQREPVPRLRVTGPELPWLRHEAARATTREAGAGTWELLLQAAKGRYLQIRITLSSRQWMLTPRLRALRVWSPRFSYPERFLPAVYREGAQNGGQNDTFLERWLANFESTLTQIEDRVANIESLFDARTVPQEALAWLAEWFDLALDPGWDERRHRLLVRHAMDFFRWRGTTHGLRLALSLAFDRDFDPAMFDGPTPLDDGAGRIRIVESYQTRLTETLIASATAQTGTVDDGLQAIVRGALWSPAEGNAGLADRYAASLQRTATPIEQITPVSLVPSAGAAVTGAAATGADVTQWSSFWLTNLGFVPSVGALERERWQRYLRAKYAGIAALNAAHGTHHPDFDAIGLPTDRPDNVTAEADWLAFGARIDGRRERKLWHDFLARRYRRIERLRSAHGSAWTGFDAIPVPDRLPITQAAQTDWLQYERQLLAMHRTAHRFSVLLPVTSVEADPYLLEERLGLARRIVTLEKPAHTVFDVRFYWAFNRVGEARLGLDTQLGAGSRASELIPTAVIGRAYLGASFVGGDASHRGRDRLSIEC